MRAVILAAGCGTRLRPLTDNRPKCMVELAGSSLLERQLMVLRAAGIDQITVVTGFRSDKIDADGCHLVHNPDYDVTNMVATLFSAREVFSAEHDLLVSYGDIIYEPRVLASVSNCTAPVCVATDIAWRAYWEARMSDPLSDAETLRLGPAGNILELGKTPEGFDDIEGQYIGLFKVRADHVRDLIDTYDAMDREGQYDGKDFANMYMTSFLQPLIDIGWAVRAAFVENGWLEVDSVEDLDSYQAMHATGRLNRFCRLSQLEGVVDRR